MSLPVMLLCVSGVWYAVAVMSLIAATRRVRTGHSDTMPYVSVVIAARNERDHIGNCLAGLAAQTYPQDRFEVIVADDRSTDGTGEVVAGFTGRIGALRVLRIDEVAPGMAPKKHAIAHAIGQAHGDIILQTDADCLPPPGWIAGMSRRFENDVVMVAGVAPYRPAPGWIASFTRHEYLWNVTLSAGSIALGHGSHASARNFAFRRLVFEEVGGYGALGTVASGDDTLLLHRVQAHYPRGVVTEPSPETHVPTDPPASLGGLLRQRMRHMSTGRHFSPFHLLWAGGVYGFTVMIPVVLVSGVIWPAGFTAAAAAFAVKAGIDSLMAVNAGQMFGVDWSWRRFVVNELLMVMYFSVIPFLGTMVPVRWKENH